MRWARILLVLPVLALLGGCGGEPTLEPPEVHYGQAVCDVCAMIVSDERFAAAVVTIEDGRRREYLLDDLGELAQLAAPAGVPAQAYVHDATTLTWVPAEDAFYVRSEEIRSPMAMELLAYAERSAAEAALAELGSGRVLTHEQAFLGR